ncbi:hypothetical protein CAY60_010655 [Shouchella clausii]|jgi:hypothetical protein|uniref:Uncharacterized protein n=1 Tax=Shouchella rhizosphaerae TaxID=866786 RepID=A0ABZ2D133_9BACI|nr:MULTISPECIES: hypothetical protein [Bacillaceae]SPU20798.1 Uncharacterised protein [Niallia circulans]ALA54550.1 hypothetical protein DB29_03722 [Shouchella clausii]MCY1104844.1 hypothetical protein [Shouchella clausii]MDO7267528.1 hypothetical protein [Shouchella clausii]MDO7282086.1 hypothetical protein [Shouchella clausii]
METMDSFAYLIMKILTVVLLVGTLGLSFFVGKVYKKTNGY